ncbi:hypothetical protein [Streptomyces sp. NBC_01262]|uniref:hypothetical protein n=1 Tax=Streptomyces sp. NBC_01262 TaxID=2903803 RepID=UPI002E324D94|nr:hypothetical protein [Streptomyces sp. NBC_01262]
MTMHVTSAAALSLPREEHTMAAPRRTSALRRVLNRIVILLHRAGLPASLHIC